VYVRDKRARVCKIEFSFRLAIYAAIRGERLAERVCRCANVCIDPRYARLFGRIIRKYATGAGGGQPSCRDLCDRAREENSATSPRAPDPTLLLTVHRRIEIYYLRANTAIRETRFEKRKTRPGICSGSSEMCPRIQAFTVRETICDI